MHSQRYLPSDTLQIGCGRTVKTINGIRYLYFWWYEDAEGESVQRFRCMGREDSPESLEKANHMAFEYYIRSRSILDKLIQQV
jgi:hypothetical protein